MNMKKAILSFVLLIGVAQASFATREKQRLADEAMRQLEARAVTAETERDAMREQVAALTRQRELYQQLAELLAGQVRTADATYTPPAEMDEERLQDLLERAQAMQQKRALGELPGEEEVLPRSSVPPAAPRDGEIQSATWTTELPH